VLRNADHTFDAAYHAADSSAHDGPNRATDRPGGAMTDGRAVAASADDALGLRHEGRCERGDDDGHGKFRLHERSSLPDVDLQRMDGFHSAIMASARDKCDREIDKSKPAVLRSSSTVKGLP
jgi:hypothetical protein